MSAHAGNQLHYFVAVIKITINHVSTTNLA